MSFQSIPEILDILQIETLYQQQPLQRLLDCWQEVVGKIVATHTQPISIERDVLWVATSSAAWSQNLTFERQRLLKKLNKILPNPLVDIRFSTARWQRVEKKPLQQQSISSREHPSYLGNSINQHTHVRSYPKNPQTVFANWVSTVKMRSQYLPLCPSCQSPTPKGELERWGVCSICAAKSF
ncbi:MAG: DciA family protein [Cyanobacteria bacterium J06635_10]